jgi:hypothetical protein
VNISTRHSNEENGTEWEDTPIGSYSAINKGFSRRDNSVNTSPKYIAILNFKMGAQ